ncbi:hypothetical protein CC78DRAFT_533076 [Lojkania enalia]|uniref:Uncharacterized protein n=1 Tax=Lojkania enalia TaxID=147567 RepID=A0A9P4N3H3_9PLEO|nr:hypothetical protein CC78DRAFT_533076 [Didymosphaeria enalia]
MYFPRLTYLPVAAALLSFGLTDPNSVCFSFGVDFVDEGDYFINSQSNESFTCVSTFQGCNEDVADVLLVDPSGDEYLCSQIPTTPADTPQLSTCPILKSQMVSGDWMVLVLGNNDDGFPFAWQRDISLDVGPQVTTTYTPTVTYDVTTTPTITSVTTSTETISSTVGPFTTITVPSKTAKFTVTVTPKPVTTSVTKTFTRSRYTWTKDLQITTTTVTATCTIPTRRKDKPATYSPTLIHPAAIETPTGRPFHRIMRKADRAVDFEYARRRIEAAKARRDQKAKEIAAPIKERAPDAPTLTITDPTPVETTITHTDPPVTTTESMLLTTTTTTTLPPVTFYSGIYTSTTTLPTPTSTRIYWTYTTTVITNTIHVTWTRTSTVTPTASVTACRRVGGHIGTLRL